LGKLKQEANCSLLLTYKMLQQKLEEEEIDVKYSGSTAVTVMIQDGRLWVANAGDSRAILKQTNSNPI
jgi:serine/threonine protein phosphatase PrpC